MKAIDSILIRKLPPLPVIVLILSVLIGQLRWSTIFLSPIDYDWLLDRYFLSQDIPHEVAPERVFLSDGEIHLAAGWLYVIGNDPIAYNFQHPPLIKYLYGLAIIGFGKPHVIQLLFGFGLVFMTFMLGKSIFNNRSVGLLSALLVLVDPVFFEVLTGYLLDMGQAFFLMVYIYILLYSNKWKFMGGIILGLLFASKFWGSSLFFVLLIGIYMLFIKKVSMKQYFIHLLLALVSYSFIYLPSFIHQDGRFNLLFFELKRLKYWFHHSTSSMLGASLILFISGWYKSWWGSRLWIQHNQWSILWPISIIANTIVGIKMIFAKQKSLQTTVFLVPILYLAFLGIQAPFSRYYILVLPFVYIGFASLVIRLGSTIKDKYVS
jgi:hypothetical protein